MTTTTKAPILVGVDGSESSHDALRYAAKVAASLGAPLRVLTTWSFPASVDLHASSGWSPEEDARTILESSIGAVFAGDPPAELTAEALHGPAAPTLIHETHGAEMLVLGSRGRGGFAGLLLGSVSSTCAAHAHCPVLVVREGVSAED